MPKQQFHFAAISKIILEHEEGTPTSILKSTDLRLEVSGNLDRSVYLDGRGMPRRDALKPITQALLSGLTLNIAMGHEKGWWKDHEHIQYIIEQLQRQFVAQKETGEGMMEY
ncbi:hypothetical protein [Flavihumibacter petaseus]|uniref:Uncharacterized protein n=1 Tax=Flavihumibacter petaseus NBRC 106054 TaxID=1220578 RepID=A0A0E9N333_9BACT|nr:hypothetical protein [Flavihumibacter petaseus]GAO43770.1 hypothetical protein FPE01S_02_08760 [Flavihumibacter petaseus NBRC 106054]